MKKIFELIKIVFRSKFIFNTPIKHDLILWDDASFFDLKNVITGYDFFVLQTRPYKINKIYISFRIIKKIIKNFKKGNFLTSYLVSLIELIEPKVVITNIDNSFKFSDVAKILETKTNFIAVQNSGSYELLEFDYLYKTKKIKKNFLKRFYIPIFYSYGNYEKELYERLGITVKKWYQLGSLRWSNFTHYIKNAKDYSPEKYECDICLIADAVRRKQSITALDPLEKQEKKKLNDPTLPDNIDIVKGYIQTVRYALKFCMKHNMKLIIPQKSDPKESPINYKGEVDFFKDNLSTDEFKYYNEHVLKNTRFTYSSYRVVLNSKVTVGAMSTLLREKLGSGGKMLSCNLTKKRMYDFPIEGICRINDCTYDEFEKRLLEIYHMSKEEYFSKINRNVDYISKVDKNYSTIDLIRIKLNEMGCKKSVNLS